MYFCLNFGDFYTTYGILDIKIPKKIPTGLLMGGAPPTSPASLRRHRSDLLFRGVVRAKKAPSFINYPEGCFRVNKGLIGAFERQKYFFEERTVMGKWGGGVFIPVISLCRLSDFTEHVSQSVMLCNSRY